MSKTEDGEKIYSKEWLLNKKDGSIGDENYSIIIAYDLEGDIPDNPYIYTYFQTDVRFPFPVLLHADFNLNSDRNHLIKNDSSNEQILEDVAELLIDTAIKVYDKGVSYNRILFLLPDEELAAELQRYDFLGTLKKKMREAEIFPTVNSKYVSYDENLKFYTSGLAKYLSGREFPDLLMYSNYTEVDRLLDEFSYSSYSYTEIAEKVKRWVSSRKVTDENIRKIAYTAIQFINEFEYTWQFGAYEEQRPSFFFNIDRKLIPSGTSVFLIDDDYEVSKPPVFAKVEFLDPYMRNYFYKRLKDEDESDEDTDAIIEKLGAYNVREFNSVELMNHMDEVIRAKIESGKLKDARDRWKTLIKWLWNNKKLLLDEGELLNIYFLTRKNSFEYSNNLYYGIEYGNQLCENLLGGIAPQNMVCDLREYIDGSNDELVEFLRLFGVLDLPRMTVENYSEYTGHYSDSCSDYIRTLFSKLSYPVTLDNTDVFRNLDEFCRQINHVDLQRTEIDLLEEILGNSSTSSIIQWIQADNSLQNHLYTGYENSSLSVQVIWGDRRTARPLASIGRPYSYIHYMFMTRPWVQVNEKRYSLSDCFLGLDSHGIDVSDYLVEPAISDYIRDMDGAKGKIKKEFQGVFEKLQVKGSISDLPIKKIYEILNYLPTVEGSEEFARSVYNEIVNHADLGLSESDIECEEYKKYLQDGKILTNNGFQLASDSYYLDGKDVCDKIAKTYNLISIPKKRSRTRIKQFFGVEHLVLIGTIVGNPIIHSENSWFAADFRQFRSLAFTYRLGVVTDIRREAKLFRDIEIIICSEIKAEYKTEKDEKSQKIELDDYEYILDGKATYYLKVPVEMERRNMMHNMQLASAVANIFSSYLDVSELVQKYRELYYAGTKDDREALIAEEYEEEAVIRIRKSRELLSADEDLQEEFLGIVSRLSGKPEKLFASYIEKIDFEDFAAEYNVKPIVETLRYAGINAGDYNSENPPIVFDLRPYYEKVIQNVMPKYREKYKATWYKKLKGRSLEERINLVSDFLLFNSAEIRVENDIDFDCHKAIVNQLEIDDSIEEMDLARLYNTNLVIWKQNQSDLRYVDEFMNRPENMSLLYYSDYDELTARYKVYCSEFAVDEEEAVPQEEKEEERTVEAFKATAKPVKVKKHSNKGRTTTGFTAKTTKKEQERIGLTGERLVYEFLLEQEGVEQVTWVSENAKKVGVNPEGGAGCGYDMEYVDSNGRRKYVEVKASTSSKEAGIRFYMSDFEYRFGSEHAEDYLVYYVSGAKSTHPQILIFENVFKNRDFNRKSFTVETSSEYTITAQADI